MQNNNDGLVAQPLSAEQLRSVLKGKSNAPRVPTLIHFWVHPNSFGDRKPQVEAILKRYPQDVQLCYYSMPSVFRGERKDDPCFSWLPYEKPAIFDSLPIDERIAMPTWDRLDEILGKFPDPENKILLQYHGTADGRYRLANWFFCLFERHWQLRGMTNALMDYYDYPEQTHKLFSALTKFYSRIIERSAVEQKCHGIWTSDDLGTQKSPFFSIDIFREFYKPYYKQMIDTAHRNGMEFWLHTCGNIEPFIPEFLEIGLDVIHPIQKFTMDEKKVVANFNGKITFLAGLDVQQVLPWGKPEDVRKEVRWLIDTFKPDRNARLIISAGNGINEDCPLENLEAFFDESLLYGARKMA